MGESETVDMAHTVYEDGEIEVVQTGLGPYVVFKHEGSTTTVWYGDDGEFNKVVKYANSG